MITAFMLGSRNGKMQAGKNTNNSTFDGINFDNENFSKIISELNRPDGRITSIKYPYNPKN
jgi:hypothetical protein